MRLVKLRLKNFLSHRETEVEFPESGIILVSGENAMGKSSLFDALRFVLFGKTFQRPSALVTKGQKVMGVEAVFTHRGHTYTALREYAAQGEKFNPKRVTFTKDGNLLLVSGPENLDQKVIQELGLNHEMFKYSVMAVQGEIMGVLSLEPSDRKAVFERMFGYQHLRLVAEASSSIVSDGEKERSAFLKARGYASVAELGRSIEKTREELSRYEALLSEIRSEKEALSREEESLEREARYIEQEEKALNEQEKERAALTGEITYLRDEIARLEKQLQDQLSRINEIPRLRERLAELEVALRELKAMREEEGMATECERAGVRVADIEKKLEETKGYEKVIRELSPSHERFLALRADEEKTRSALERIRTSIGEANQLNEVISAKQREIGDLEGRLSAFQEIRESRSEILKTIEQKESEIRKTEAELGQATERMKRAEKDISAIEKLGDTCPLCKQRLTPEHRAEVLSKLRAEYSEAKALAEEHGRRSQSLKGEVSDLKKLAQRAEQKERIEELLARAMDEERAAREKLAELSGIIKECEALEKVLEGIRVEIKALEQSERELAFAEDFIRKNPKESLERELSAARDDLAKALERRRFPDMSLDEIKMRIASLAPVEVESAKIEADINNLERLAAEAEKTESSIREKQSRLAEAESRLRTLAGIETRKAELESRKKSYTTANKELQSKRSSLAERETAVRKDKEAVEKELQSLSEAKGEAERIERKISLFSRIRDRLLSPDGIEREFTTAMLRLEDNLNMYFQDFSFSGAYAVRLNSDLMPVKIDEMGREMERLSGGEQVAMGIAMRFAIASTLLDAESESLFLDEPTHNLDSERTSSLQELLEGFKLRQIAPQIIIITHEDNMKSIADSVLEVVKKEGVSSVKKIRWDI